MAFPPGWGGCLPFCRHPTRHRNCLPLRHHPTVHEPRDVGRVKLRALPPRLEHLSLFRDDRTGLDITLVPITLPRMAAEVAKKPNILVVMGDDVRWSNVGAYHRGIMFGKTPSLDKLKSAWA